MQSARGETGVFKAFTSVRLFTLHGSSLFAPSVTADGAWYHHIKNQPRARPLNRCNTAFRYTHTHHTHVRGHTPRVGVARARCRPAAAHGTATGLTPDTYLRERDRGPEAVSHLHTPGLRRHAILRHARDLSSSTEGNSESLHNLCLVRCCGENTLCTHQLRRTPLNK